MPELFSGTKEGYLPQLKSQRHPLLHRNPEDIFKKLVLALKATGTRKQKGLSVDKQRLLTLMRLRLGLLCEDLAKRFGISVSVVSKVFTTRW